jgi:hypothetical protein
MRLVLKIERAFDSQPGLLQHVRVNLGRFDIGVTQELLHCPDIIAFLR